MSFFNRSSNTQKARPRPHTSAERASIIQSHHHPDQDTRSPYYTQQNDSEYYPPPVNEVQQNSLPQRQPSSYLPGQYTRPQNQGYSAPPQQQQYQSANPYDNRQSMDVQTSAGYAGQNTYAPPTISGTKPQNTMSNASAQVHPAYAQNNNTTSHHDRPSSHHSSHRRDSSHHRDSHHRDSSHKSHHHSHDSKDHHRTSVLTTASSPVAANFSTNRDDRLTEKRSRRSLRNRDNRHRSKRHHPVRTFKNHLVAISGEFVGTFLFLWLAFAVHLMAVQQTAGAAASNGANSSQTIVFISLGYGFALLVAAWNFYRVSGGLFNPAVTIGLIAAGQLPAIRGLLLIPFQILGAMAAAGLVSSMFPGAISAVETTLAQNVSITQGLFIEMLLTAVLVYTVLMLAAEKTRATPLAPVGIGLALFICELAGVYFTGASLNPARSFGPCVAARSFQGYHWIYWLGPVLGALLAAAYYRVIKAFDYEDANPGQDDVTDNEADGRA